MVEFYEIECYEMMKTFSTDSTAYVNAYDSKKGHVSASASLMLNIYLPLVFYAKYHLLTNICAIV
jgi:hypothetical protein